MRFVKPVSTMLFQWYYTASGSSPNSNANKVISLSDCCLAHPLAAATPIKFDSNSVEQE